LAGARWLKKINMRAVRHSVLQFAMTPGTSEAVNLVPTYYHFGRVGASRTPLAGRVYRVVKDIPKGTQVRWHHFLRECAAPS
jgi:hypothetical protein